MLDSSNLKIKRTCTHLPLLAWTTCTTAMEQFGFQFSIPIVCWCPSMTLRLLHGKGVTATHGDFGLVVLF